MTYPGGKAGAGVYHKIINQIPPHETYIEPFVGGGAILKNIRPARSIIAIDSDASAIRPFYEMPGVTAIEGCGLAYLEGRKFKGDEFVYCDPPYVMDTRKSKRDIYKQEWADSDHERFLRTVTDLPCKVAISGYFSALYDEHLSDWRRISFIAQTRQGPALEELWMNYPEPTALHDCRYLGSDFRERERLNRKAKRWAKNFDKMSELEQQHMLSFMLQRTVSLIAINSEGSCTP